MNQLDWVFLCIITATFLALVVAHVKNDELYSQLLVERTALERSKKMNGVLLDVAREHKKKRDMYRHQMRETNRRLRNSVTTSPPLDELYKQAASLQAATATQYQPFLPYGMREIKVKAKVGG